MSAQLPTPTAVRPGGIFTALVTPMHANGALDLETLAAHVDAQIAAGVQGLVAVGTTGESPTLDLEEDLAVITKVVEVAAGRALVFAGTGTNATREGRVRVREADARGIDGHLQVAPYYNKPSQEGLYRHFSELAGETEKPIMLYSIPGRCGVEIAVETVARLHRACPHVSSIKEAGGRPEKVLALRAAAGPGLTVMCGDDGLTLPFMAAGAKGTVSVASNLIPSEMVTLVRLAQTDFPAAQALQDELLPLLTDGVFLEGNPATIKTAMHLAGRLPTARMRLPLCEMATDNVTKLRDILAQAELLSTDA